MNGGDSKKTICMVIQNSSVKGGIASVVNGYRGSMLEKDFNITYVESYKDGAKIFKLLKAMKGYIHFVKVLVADKPDLIHIHSSFGASFYRKLPFIYMSAFAGKPVINHIHGADFDEFYLNASERKKRLIRRVYNKCSSLVVLSDDWKERFTAVVPKEKISVIENYSIIFKDVSMKRNSLRTGKKTVLFLGEIGRRKGCYDIPNVLECVLKDVPNVNFVLCGYGAAKDVDAVMKLFRDKGISEHVTFTGWICGAEKDRLLRNSDVFFLPSYNEGMPMSILEAIGYGLPVVSSDVGGIAKIVHSGENGYCFKAGSVDEFSRSLVRLLTDNELLEKMSLNSLHIAAKYSFENHLEKLEALYESTNGKC